MGGTMKKQYKFPEILMDEKMAQEILTGAIPVLLYGMGAAAADKITALRNQGVEIICGLDQNSKLWGTELLGVPIYSPGKFLDTEKPIVICTESYYMDLTITEKCSLRCKDCSNLMQYFEKPMDASLEKSLEAIDKITAAVDELNEIRVLGGEPFLAKDFSKYMNHICKIKNVGTIVVYSNATIIPKDDILNALRHPKVTVRMSDYGEVSRNLDRIISIFEEQEIFYSVIAYSD